jgi:formylglycine-generating enzyme required for sulfatase activity
MLKDIRNAALGALAVLALAGGAPAQSCAGDLDGSGEVDGADLGSLLNAWGSCSSCAADLNGDGAVNGLDLGTLLTNWEACQIITPSWATLVEARPDPAVVTDPALLAAIEATGLAWRVRDTATQVEMLLVPPGTFQMGCVMGSDRYGCYEWELPVHQVTLTNAFYLGRYEVTQAQWVATMRSNPSFWTASSGFPGSDARPVEWVSWTIIQGYLSATGFRLPTEAEWEYACRAGTQTPFYNGSTDDSTVGSLAWYEGNTGGGPTNPVGSKLANAFGFHDMLGNVWEWVNDWYEDYPTESQTNPSGPGSSGSRVQRGGFYDSFTNDLRSSMRFGGPPDYRFPGLGFRVARNP